MLAWRLFRRRRGRLGFFGHRGLASDVLFRLFSSGLRGILGRLFFFLLFFSWDLCELFVLRGDLALYVYI